MFQKNSWHFHRRLLDRYGLTLGPGDYSGMIRAIKKGVALVIKQQGPRKVVYWVRIPSTGKHIFVLAVGDHLRTAYPSTRVRRRRRREILAGLDPP